MVKEAEAASRRLGLQAQIIAARDASEIDKAFQLMTRERAEALAVLSECHRDISSEAPACPHCGAPKACDATCRNCHFPVPPGVTVCPQCGAVGPVRGFPGAAPATGPPGVILVQARKSRGVFIVLGLFLGCLGIHNFYAGYYAKDTVQLAVTLVLGWIIVGFVITAIWALIEIITVTADAEGHAMA